ncbi:MAG: signal peptidase I [Myxococcota bacterium]|nr:signal peptidase I [Myxococcota bacterium]
MNAVNDVPPEQSAEAVPVKKESAWDGIRGFLWVILFALTVRWLLVEPYRIPSGSMIPSLAVGDQIFVNKLSYGVRVPFTTNQLIEFSEPTRGDVAVFVCPDTPELNYIKRIVALAGDEVVVRNGVLAVNGETLPRESQGDKVYQDRHFESSTWFEFNALEETEGNHGVSYEVLADNARPAPTRDFGPFVVPEGHVFMMGDNRDHSRDSRVFGAVPVGHIMGRAMFIWWSWGKDGFDTERVGLSLAPKSL